MCFGWGGGVEVEATVIERHGMGGVEKEGGQDAAQKQQHTSGSSSSLPPSLSFPLLCSKAHSHSLEHGHVEQQVGINQGHGVSIQQQHLAGGGPTQHVTQHSTAHQVGCVAYL